MSLACWLFVIANYTLNRKKLNNTVDSLLTSTPNNRLLPKEGHGYKNEVGMAVLKCKQTRVVYRDNQHIRMVHPYVCLLSTTLAVLVNRSI